MNRTFWLLPHFHWPKLIPGKISLLLTSYFLLLASYSTAQSDIPIGTWRLHLSYNTIKTIALGTTQVFGASESGILVFNRDDNSISTYNTLTGLSGTGISHIAFDHERSQLLVGYEDGNLDIIRNNEVINFNRLKNSTTLTGSKKINHISIHSNSAYLSTEYGVVVFDLLNLELRETWRDLGPLGTSLKIIKTTFRNNNIFIASEKGVLVGDLTKNLLDFNNFKRFDTGDFSSAITAIESFNSEIYAAVNGKGIYRYKDDVWTKENFLQGLVFNSLESSGTHLVIASTSGVWRLSTTNELSPIESGLITTPLSATEDTQQKLWIGDQQNGLLSDYNGNLSAYLPNGPTVSSASRLRFQIIKGQGVIAAVPGGYTSSGQPLENSGTLQLFENNQWRMEQKSLNDLTDFEVIGSAAYTSSFGDGIEKSDDNANTIIDHTNSPLENLDPSGKKIFITALKKYGDDLWVANYGASKSLHRLRESEWQSFPLCCAARFPKDLVIDFSGNVWMQIDPQQGGGIQVFHPENNLSLYHSSGLSHGGLPTQSVNAMAVDRDGYVWIGTDEGVAYFFSPQADAIKPIFENRFLLRDEKITAIQVDGGNRKWIGTEHGVWLFGPSGETLIHNFTVENSPLLSDVILDIETNDMTGEVFFSTDKGIISYRADATTGESVFRDLKIFPNPVTANFTGTVGISGLATDAIVKITDVSGKLIWQTQASGGTATWNVRDYNGRRASTGVYLVFAATEDGTDRIVGKIAVVE